MTTRVFNVRKVTQRQPDDVYIGRAGHDAIAAALEMVAGTGGH